MVVGATANASSDVRRVILVTGAASGIGRAIVERSLADGCSVVAMDREAAQDLESDQIVAIAGDVTDPEACRIAVDACTDRFGRLDGLAHSAGIQRYGTVEETSDALWNEVIGVNLTGAFNITRAAMPALIASKGAVAFIGSVQSMASQRGVVAYTASKHGLLGLARAVAMDSAAQGVRVNVVAPGAVDTPMLDWAVSLSDAPQDMQKTLARMHPMGRVATAEEVAAVTSFLLGPDASFVTGEVIRVDGGLLGQIAGSPEDTE